MGPPPQVGTIGSTIAARLHMTLYCDAMGCHHSQTVDLETLSRELGLTIVSPTSLRGAAAASAAPKGRRLHLSWSL
jgi:hypothetical protein